jgi:hypothetical protein
MFTNYSIHQGALLENFPTVADFEGYVSCYDYTKVDDLSNMIYELTEAGAKDYLSPLVELIFIKANKSDYFGWETSDLVSVIMNLFEGFKTEEFIDFVEKYTYKRSKISVYVYRAMLRELKNIYEPFRPVSVAFGIVKVLARFDLLFNTPYPGYSEDIMTEYIYNPVYIRQKEHSEVVKIFFAAENGDIVWYD